MHRQHLSKALGRPVAVLVGAHGDPCADLLQVVLCYGYSEHPSHARASTDRNNSAALCYSILVLDTCLGRVVHNREGEC